VSRGIPIYPVLLAVGLVLSIVVPSGANPYAAIRLLIGFALGALAVCAAARALLGDGDRAGVAATIVVLFVFKGIDVRIAVLLMIALGIIIVERLSVAWRPSLVPWGLAGRVMNAGAAVLFVAVFLQAAGNGSLWPFVGAIRSEAPVAFRNAVLRGTPVAETPDVYLLILDGHARADKLESVFDYDASPIVAALESRRFEVAPASRSNYLLTAHSLTSMLNMGHVTDIVDSDTVDATASGYTSEIRRLSSNGLVMDRFRELGYETIAIASGFEEVALRGADRFIDTGQVNELEVRTIGNTVVAPAIQLLAPDWFADQHRARVVSVFQAAKHVASEVHDQPRFVIVHVPSPHAPIVFGEEGSAVPMTDLANFYDDTFTHRAGPKDAELARYAAQVSHVDDLAIPVVDEILSGASIPPVVLVVSDHGSGAGLTWNDLAGSDLDERTAILFAAYTPGRSGVFPSDISLVNVFGLLFEAYFGRAYEPQPDTAYGWTEFPLDLVPISLPEAPPTR
jgi:hypothetical protein